MELIVDAFRELSILRGNVNIVNMEHFLMVSLVLKITFLNAMIHICFGMEKNAFA